MIPFQKMIEADSNQAPQQQVSLNGKARQSSFHMGIRRSESAFGRKIDEIIENKLFAKEKDNSQFFIPGKPIFFAFSVFFIQITRSG